MLNPGRRALAQYSGRLCRPQEDSGRLGGLNREGIVELHPPYVAGPHVHAKSKPEGARVGQYGKLPLTIPFRLEMI